MCAFSFFDKDGSGYITIDELQQACKEFGLSDVHLDEMIKEIDQDNVSSFFFLNFTANYSYPLALCTREQFGSTLFPFWC